MANTTITTTAQQDARIAPAFGDFLHLTVPGTATPRNATGAEVKQALVDFIINVVKAYEHNTLVAAVVDPSPITPT